MARSLYADHPRYGRWPRTTEVVPQERLGYRLRKYHGAIIPGTAVAADLDEQAVSAVPVLYYFDTECTVSVRRRPTAACSNPRDGCRC